MINSSNTSHRRTTSLADFVKQAGQAEDEAAAVQTPEGQVPEEGLAPPQDPVLEENSKLQALLENAELKMSLLNASKEYEAAKAAIKAEAEKPLPDLDIHTGLAKEVVQHTPTSARPVKGRSADEQEARQETIQQDAAVQNAANDKE